MKTYDYYKNKTTHSINPYTKMFVDQGEDGQARVKIEQGPEYYPYPVYCLRKGVWEVRRVLGATQYVPEGDPEYNADGEQLVWGQIIASRKACEIYGTDEYEEYGYPYTKKMIVAAKAYWAKK